MPARDLASGAPEPPTRRPKLYLPAGDRIIRARISEASYTAALDLAGADEPHEVLLDAQFGGSRPENRLGQLQAERPARSRRDRAEPRSGPIPTGARFGLPLRASFLPLSSDQRRGPTIPHNNGDKTASSYPAATTGWLTDRSRTATGGWHPVGDDLVSCAPEPLAKDIMRSPLRFSEWHGVGRRFEVGASMTAGTTRFCKRICSPS